MDAEYITDYISKVIELVHLNNENYNSTLTLFRFTCIVNDLYLKDFTYNNVLGFWRHNTETTQFITVKDLRRLIMTNLRDIVFDLYKFFLTRWNKELDVTNKNLIEPRMKITRYMSELLNDGSVFKDLIDSYKKGYF
jgi:hypothetical protein